MHLVFRQEYRITYTFDKLGIELICFLLFLVPTTPCKAFYENNSVWTRKPLVVRYVTRDPRCMAAEKERPKAVLCDLYDTKRG